LQSANVNFDDNLSEFADAVRGKKRKAGESESSSDDPVDSTVGSAGAALLPRKRPAKSYDWTDAILDVAQYSNRSSKDSRIHQALSSVLAQLDDLPGLLKKHNTMWFMLKRVQHDASRDYASFEEFANHAIQTGSAYEIAQVAQILAFQCEPTYFDQVTFIVDRFIMCDDDYMGTLEGLNCALVQGNLLQEAGQLRKAWQIFRRGIQQAELLGIHQQRTNVQQDVCWWSLYCQDRVASLKMGKPYSIVNSHCNMSFRGGRAEDDSMHSFEAFLAHIGQITGRVIDHLMKFYRNDSDQLDELMRVDEELVHFAARMPQEFWEGPSPCEPTGEMDLSIRWRESILKLLVYHQTYFALHLPYLIKSIEDPSYEVIHDRCLQGARRFLRLFIRLRDPNNTIMRQCSTFDAVGCAATIILILGQWNSDKTDLKIEEDTEDGKLIYTVFDLFRNLSKESPSSSASMSWRALQQFTSTGRLFSGNATGMTPKFTVPFFDSNFLERADAVLARSRTIRTTGSIISSAPAFADFMDQNFTTNQTGTGLSPIFPSLQNIMAEPAPYVPTRYDGFDFNRMEDYQMPRWNGWNGMGPVVGVPAVLPADRLRPT